MQPALPSKAYSNAANDVNRKNSLWHHMCQQPEKRYVQFVPLSVPFVTLQVPIILLEGGGVWGKLSRGLLCYPSCIFTPVVLLYFIQMFSFILFTYWFFCEESFFVYWLQFVHDRIVS